MLIAKQQVGRKCENLALSSLPFGHSICLLNSFIPATSPTHVRHKRVSDRTVWVNYMTDFALWRKTALALAIGSVGAIIAFWINLPAPALTGPSIAVTIAGLLGLNLAFETRVRDISFLVIGLSMGTSVTPEVYQSAKQWPISLLAIVAAVSAAFFSSRSGH